MSGKLQETATNESSLNLDAQTVNHNPYVQVHHVDNTNVNQQRPIVYEKAPEEPPPAYNTVIQSSPDLSRIEQQNRLVENDIQDISLNKQDRPFPPGHKWPRFSINTVCPHCGVTSHTRLETSSTIITFILAIILFLFCCCLAIIPFCVPSCKKSTHYCSNCHAVLGEVHEFQ